MTNGAIRPPWTHTGSEGRVTMDSSHDETFRPQGLADIPSHISISAPNERDPSEKILSYESAPSSSEPSSSLLRPSFCTHHTLLWLACGLTFGVYFAKDVLAAGSTDLMNDFNMTREQYGTIYGLPAIPNTIVSLLGGVIVDRLGSDRSSFFLTIVVVIGSLFISLAGLTNLTVLLAVGQLCMGLGKGTLITAQKVYLKLMSHPKEVSLYFAFSFSVSHAGTFSAFLISPLVSQVSSIGYEASLWMSSTMCLLSCLCSVPLLGSLKTLKEKPPQESLEAPRVVVVVDEEEEEEEKEEGEQEEEESGGREALDLLSWKDKAALYIGGCWNQGFILVTLSIVFYYLAFFPFVTFSVDFLKVTRGVPKAKASLYASLLSLASIFLGPIFGRIVDAELQSATHWLFPPGSVQLWSMILTSLGLALISFLPQLWIIGFVLMGLAFAMASASVWPMVPVFVDKSSLGLAFGITHCLMDIALMVLDIYIGRLLDGGVGYTTTVVPILLACSLVALTSSLLLLRLLPDKCSRVVKLPPTAAAAAAEGGEAGGRKKS